MQHVQQLWHHVWCHPMCRLCCSAKVLAHQQCQAEGRLLERRLRHLSLKHGRLCLENGEVFWVLSIHFSRFRPINYGKYKVSNLSDGRIWLWLLCWLVSTICYGIPPRWTEKQQRRGFRWRVPNLGSGGKTRMKGGKTCAKARCTAMLTSFI